MLCFEALQRFKFKSQLKLLLQTRSLIILTVESSIISKDSNATDIIIKNIIYSRKRLGQD